MRSALTTGLLLVATPIASAQSLANNDDLNCESASVICLDARGSLLGPTPSELRPGDTVTVHVVATTNAELANIELLRAKIKVEASTRMTVSSLFAKRITQDAVRLNSTLQQAFLSIELNVPKKTRAAAIDVHVHGWNVNTGGPTGPRRYSIAIAHGRFYLQLGVLVPFVIDGDREVIAAIIPSSTARALSISEDVSITPALSMTLFPWGHRNESLSPFENMRFWDSIGDFVGLQVAKDFDFSSLDRWYVGVLAQPVRGVSLSTGIALLRGEFLAGGAQPGMLLDAQATVDSLRVKKLMARGYVGITVDQDVLEALSAGLKALRELAD